MDSPAIAARFKRSSTPSELLETDSGESRDAAKPARLWRAPESAHRDWRSFHVARISALEEDWSGLTAKQPSPVAPQFWWPAARSSHGPAAALRLRRRAAMPAPGHDHPARRARWARRRSADRRSRLCALARPTSRSRVTAPHRAAARQLLRAASGDAELRAALSTEGRASIVHAAATSYRERSHFDGQDVLESGIPRPVTSNPVGSTAPSPPCPPRGHVTARERSGRRTIHRADHARPSAGARLGATDRQRRIRRSGKPRDGPIRASRSHPEDGAGPGPGDRAHRNSRRHGRRKAGRGARCSGRHAPHGGRRGQADGGR